MPVQHDYIRSEAELTKLCHKLESASVIAFDTEFVSEDTYRPDLCLIQIAAGETLAVIDPKQVADIKPFWEVLCGGQHTTVVHAAREEFRFVLHGIGQWPSRLFDTQIAAGMVGLDYPSSYSKLIGRLLEKPLAKGETRTDWRRRPLSSKQIEYALQDVVYLADLHENLMSRLCRLKRVEWLSDEMTHWQSALQAFEEREHWNRVSGATGLSDKSMAILRELWRWRESTAKNLNRPPRRILRDDLMVELARRGKSEVSQIRAIRGIERSGAKRYLDEIAKAIGKAIALPRAQWPKREKHPTNSRSNLVGQFVAIALGAICRSQELAPGLVGSVQDVRDLVDYRLSKRPDEEPPSLARGWRAQVVGRTIDELLDGKLAIRIDNPKAAEPLTLDEVHR